MQKVHLDTDLGGDIDDICALAMILNWPDADLIAVTTNSDDGGRRAGYTRYALQLAGRGDVPVAAGADIAGGWYRIRPDLPDEARYWPEPIPPHPTPVADALTLLERSIAQDAIIIAIGPFTNLALLEREMPGILRRAKLYLMGGYIFPLRPGFPDWDNGMDWNVQVDVQSANLVLARSNPTLIPISVTAETALRAAHLAPLRQAGPLARLIAHQAAAFAEHEQMAMHYGQTCAGLPDDIMNFLHDPLACAIALGWNEDVVVRDVPLRYAIHDGLLDEIIDESGALTKVVTKVDGAKFNEFWLKTVTRSYENVTLPR